MCGGAALASAANVADVSKYFGRGNNGASHPGKPVAKYSLEGELLATYPSIAFAAQAEQISLKRISAAITRGKILILSWVVFGGFYIWMAISDIKTLFD